jgi:hypothetical protein
MTKPLCIYHATCADGFTAAWVIWKHFKGEVDFFPGVYQTPPPDVKGRDVVFVDFSYKRAIMEVMLNLANSVTIIDHHKTAIEDLKGLPFKETVFDTNHSGAMLAWMWMNPGIQGAPPLIRYVEDRDLWKFRLTESRNINACIFAYEYTFENWNYLHNFLLEPGGLQLAATMGAAIERKHHKDVAELVKATRRNMEIGGHIIPVANLPYTLTSDAGHLMASELTGGKVFAACYWDTPEGRVFSLRATDEGMDVAEIAKQYGGGGHKHAAGFKVPFDQLVEKGLL